MSARYSLGTAIDTTNMDCFILYFFPNSVHIHIQICTCLHSYADVQFCSIVGTNGASSL